MVVVVIPTTANSWPAILLLVLTSSDVAGHHIQPGSLPPFADNGFPCFRTVIVSHSDADPYELLYEKIGTFLCCSIFILTLYKKENKLKILKENYKMLEKVKIKGLIKIFAMACFCTFTVLYVPYMSLIRIRICISPNGSGYYYTNPDPRIWIRITGSSLAVYGCISGDPDPFCSSDRPDRPPFRISWRGGKPRSTISSEKHVREL